MTSSMLTGDRRYGVYMCFHLLQNKLSSLSMCLVLHGPVGGQTVFSHGIDITPLKLVQYRLRGALPFYQDCLAYHTS
jgi:hypothetical protein